MIKTMTNIELVNAFNSLVALKDLENNYYKKTGDRLFKGRVKISFAINKNIQKFQKSLEPYNKTINELNEEIRDLEAEKAAIEQAKETGKDPNEIDVIIKEGFSEEEYFKKRKEIFEIETEVDVHEIDLELFEDIDLSCGDIGALMFMIRE